MLFKTKKIVSIIVGCIAVFISCQYTMQAAPAYAYRIRFTNKDGTLTYADSLQFLSAKSLLRRSQQQILLDSTDLPVVKSYIDTVMLTTAAVKLHNVSKWLNQIVVITYDSLKGYDALNLPMVSDVKLVARYANGIFKTSPENSVQTKYAGDGEPSNKTTGNSAYYGLAFQQIDMLEADCLHDLGFKGQGMDIAVFDVNFRRVDSCRIFDSIRLENRIIDTYDFVKDTNYVYSAAINNGHGTNVLSCMAGNIPGTYVGTAPLANYYLYMSEDNYSEQPIEMDNWLSAAEYADSVGVKMVNSSLGYNNFDALFASSSVVYADLTGNKTVIAQALNKLAAKGVLVVQAQGNEGAAAWHYMLTPADADSAYSVGSVDGSGAWASSGYGPNFAGLTKPDGVALGKAAMISGSTGNCDINASNGSSFASPIMCGAIACLWQALPDKTSWEIRQLVRMSSDRYSVPNYTHGYGMPNLCSAYSIALGTSPVQQIDYRFTVAPNPIQDTWAITCYDAGITQYTFSIYNMAGQCVYQHPVFEKNRCVTQALRSAPGGQYVLCISTPQKIFTHIITKP